MSFILDALKKSENERARQNGPALLEARVAPRSRGVPAWALVVGGILLANLGVLMFVLLRQPAPPTVVVMPAATPPAPTPAPAPVPPAAAPPAAPPPSANLPPEPAIVGPGTEYVPPGGVVINPADFQPARPAPSASAPPRDFAPPATNEQQDADAQLPTAADLSAGGSGLPAQRLALHVYDQNPSGRFVLLGSRRLREGETNDEGVRIERITPEGAIASWRGQRFRLLPGD